MLDECELIKLNLIRILCALVTAQNLNTWTGRACGLLSNFSGFPQVYSISVYSLDPTATLCYIVHPKKKDHDESEKKDNRSWNHHPVRIVQKVTCWLPEGESVPQPYGKSNEWNEPTKPGKAAKEFDPGTQGSTPSEQENAVQQKFNSTKYQKQNGKGLHSRNSPINIDIQKISATSRLSWRSLYDPANLPQTHMNISVNPYSIQTTGKLHFCPIMCTNCHGQKYLW